MTLSEIFAAFICGSGNITENDLFTAESTLRIQQVANSTI